MCINGYSAGLSGVEQAPKQLSDDVDVSDYYCSVVNLSKQAEELSL